MKTDSWIFLLIMIFVIAFLLGWFANTEHAQMKTGKQIIEYMETYRVAKPPDYQQVQTWLYPDSLQFFRRQKYYSNTPHYVFRKPTQSIAQLNKILSSMEIVSNCEIEIYESDTLSDTLYVYHNIRRK